MSPSREPKNARRQAAREAAARQREAEQRRARRIRTAVIAIATAVAVGVTAVVVLPFLRAANPTEAVGTGWAAPTDVEAAVQSAGLKMLTAEGTALHTHQHLIVTVDGAAISVPAGLGIDQARGRISSIHTHDDSGRDC